MKKRIATLLTLVLLTAMLLCGCGGKEATETMNNNSGNSSSGFLSKITSKKSQSLSDVLSTEKVIGYTVDSVDKSEIPNNIYFFNEGKLTIIPGYEFALTMGDFANMSDAEIWENYETVREAYAETYREKQNKKIQEQIDYVNGDIKTMQNGIDWDEDVTIPELQQYLQEATEMNDEQAIEGYNMEINAIMADIEDEKEVMQGLQAEITALQDLMSNSSYAEPFFEVEFKCVAESDSSGNSVLSEKLVYPTLEYSLSAKVPEIFYSSTNFVLGLTRQEQIYDTTYNCIGLKGSGSFLTREKMDLDTSFDSEYLLIDLSDDELNELFKEEVTKRFECN